MGEGALVTCIVPEELKKRNSKRANVVGCTSMPLCLTRVEVLGTHAFKVEMGDFLNGHVPTV
jgi:hypothetical protein